MTLQDNLTIGVSHTKNFTDTYIYKLIFEPSLEENILFFLMIIFLVILVYTLDKVIKYTEKDK